jgi:hypothetical protein
VGLLERARYALHAVCPLEAEPAHAHAGVDDTLGYRITKCDVPLPEKVLLSLSPTERQHSHSDRQEP